MRRILPFLLMISSCLLCYAESVEIVPYPGVYGVNIGSTHYQGGTEWEPVEWPSDPKLNYTNNQIIAVAGLYNAGSGSNASYTISVSAPGGMSFKSQSHPAYERPFEILVIPRYRVNRSGTTGYDSYSGDYRRLSADGMSYTVRVSDLPFENGTPDPDYLWCDIVLVLPFDDDPSSLAGKDYIMVGGRQYPLTEADDYTALLTITIASDRGTTSSIAIPFSGYYDGNPESGKGESLVSLMYTANSAARNLDIQNDAGVPVVVGEIDFLMDAEAGDRAGEVQIFLSSSNNPYDTAPSPFRFLHSSLQPSSPITNYNSVGYEVRVRGYEAGMGFNETVFDGTGHLYLVGGEPTCRSIVPNYVENSGLLHVEANNGRDKYYYEYQGEVSVVIDSPAATMLPGRYTSTVYIHVVTEQGT